MNFNSGCSQSNTNDEDEVVKKRTSVFVLYVDTLAEEYEEMDRSVLRFGHNHVYCSHVVWKNCIFFFKRKKIQNCSYRHVRSACFFFHFSRRRQWFPFKDASKLLSSYKAHQAEYLKALQSDTRPRDHNLKQVRFCLLHFYYFKAIFLLHL